MKMKKLFTLFIAGLFCISAMSQTIYYVKTDGSDTNDGLSWSGAFATLTKAISMSVKDDEIRVGAGTFISTATYTITMSLTIKGGFNVSTGIQDYSNKTVLNGNNTYRIMRSYWLTYGHVPEVKLDGFVFKNANSAGYSGAAVFDKCNGIITNCAFINNSSPSYGGGGMAFTNCTTKSTIVNCLFSGNSGKDGGAIFAGTNEVLDIINCTIAQNSCTTGSGGGIYSTATINLMNTIIWGNKKGTNDDQIYGSGTNNLNHNIVQGGKSAVPGTVNITNSDAIDANNNDPLFIDVANGDMHVQSSASPAVNSGTNTLIPTTITTDLDNNQRIFNSTVDLGCYEFFVSTNYKDIASVNDIRVYPNPTIESIKIESMSSVNSIKIMDYTGKCVLFQNVNALKSVTLNVTALPKGLYLISIDNYTTKLVIQ